MADTVKVQFTAKPGLYPAHKGGRTWLHQKAGPRKVPHEQGPGGFTTRIVPTIIIQSGETFEESADMAKTLTSRYPDLFKVIPSESGRKAFKPKDADA